MTAETLVPTFDKLIWPATCALKQMGGSASHQELLDKLIELGKIPEEVQNVSHTTGRQTKLGYNLRWGGELPREVRRTGEHCARRMGAHCEGATTQGGGHQRGRCRGSQNEPGEAPFRRWCART